MKALKLVHLVLGFALVVVSFQNCTGQNSGDQTGALASASVNCWQTVSQAVNVEYVTPGETFQVSAVNSANPSMRIVSGAITCANVNPSSLPSYATFKSRVNGMSVCVSGNHNNTQLNTDVGGVPNPGDATVKPKGGNFQSLLNLMDSLTSEAKAAGKCL